MTSSAPCDDRRAVIDHRFVVMREGRAFIDIRILDIDDLAIAS
jgi:hypothetical protein